MKKTATFLITLEWKDDIQNHLTPNMVRDKLLTPLQELWILHVISKFSIDEVEEEPLSHLEHKNTKGKRKSFYKTGFPKKK